MENTGICLFLKWQMEAALRVSFYFDDSNLWNSEYWEVGVILSESWVSFSSCVWLRHNLINKRLFIINLANMSQVIKSWYKFRCFLPKLCFILPWFSSVQHLTNTPFLFRDIFPITTFILSFTWMKNEKISDHGVCQWALPFIQSENITFSFLHLKYSKFEKENPYWKAFFDLNANFSPFRYLIHIHSLLGED